MEILGIPIGMCRNRTVMPHQPTVRSVLSLESEHRSKISKFLTDDVTQENFFGLPSGIYLVEVLTQNGQRSVQKVVVSLP